LSEGERFAGAGPLCMAAHVAAGHVAPVPAALVLGGLVLWALGGWGVEAGAEPPAADTALSVGKPGSADTLAAAPIPKIEPPAGATPWMVLAQIERGWQTGSPELVVGCLASEGIQIELDQSGQPAGRFACPQAEFLIRDLLHYGQTLDFRLTRFEWKGENPRAEAEWVHRMGAAERTLEVEIELAESAGHWRVVRLKSH
jgi:hypothetical protein